MNKLAYFAGGCFWGMEKFMSYVPGVICVTSGYANGNASKYANPTYDMVCTGLTGFKESVKVEYDDARLSYEMLVRAYFMAIDPTVENRQGMDIGEQYQTGIYYLDDEQKEIANIVSNEVRTKVAHFAVKIESLDSFFDAEEYHQKYLVKNHMGYCHISSNKIRKMLAFFENMT